MKRESLLEYSVIDTEAVISLVRDCENEDEWRTVMFAITLADEDLTVIVTPQEVGEHINCTTDEARVGLNLAVEHGHLLPIGPDMYRVSTTLAVPQRIVGAR